MRKVRNLKIWIRGRFNHFMDSVPEGVELAEGDPGKATYVAFGEEVEVELKYRPVTP